MQRFPQKKKLTVPASSSIWWLWTTDGWLEKPTFSPINPQTLFGFVTQQCSQLHKMIVAPLRFFLRKINFLWGEEEERFAGVKLFESFEISFTAGFFFVLLLFCLFFRHDSGFLLRLGGATWCWNWVLLLVEWNPASGSRREMLVRVFSASSRGLHVKISHRALTCSVGALVSALLIVGLTPMHVWHCWTHAGQSVMLWLQLLLCQQQQRTRKQTLLPTACKLVPKLPCFSKCNEKIVTAHGGWEWEKGTSVGVEHFWWRAAAAASEALSLTRDDTAVLTTRHTTMCWFSWLLLQTVLCLCWHVVDFFVHVPQWSWERFHLRTCGRLDRWLLFCVLDGFVSHCFRSVGLHAQISLSYSKVWSLFRTE